MSTIPAENEHPQPTPYPDINAVLATFLVQTRTILGTHFQGMYLSGSLALGDFAPHRSDIDFVVVTDVEVTDELLTALHAMHTRFNASDSPWATEIEAAYIPLAALRRYDPAHALHPHIERGRDRELLMDQLDSAWIFQYAVLREHGIVVAGPPLSTLIEPVSALDLRHAVVEFMDEWWETMLNDATPLQYKGYQVYAVLTMCRMLYTLATGTVASKPVAARWAQDALDKRWHTLIEPALTWSKDRVWGKGQPTQPEDIMATQALIRYTLECCQKPFSPPL